MKKYPYIILMTMIGLSGISCQKENQTPQESTAFILSDSLLRLINLDTVQTEVVRNELTLVGKVVPDENKVIKVFPLVGGNVENVSVELGDKVKKGQKLATIRSGEIAEFERQMIEAQSDLLIAQKNLSSTQDLYESKLVPERDMITHTEIVGKAKAELNRVKEIFSIYGIGKSNAYTVIAPIDGFVIQKNVNPGTQLRSDNSESLFTIGQIENVWVLANVNEGDIPRIKAGMSADVRTISYPDQVFKGKVDKIYNVLDSETRAMKIRIQLQNVDFKLKPEMHATVYLNFEEEEKMQTVASSALIFDRSKNWVLVFHNPGKIEARPVEVYRTLTKSAYIKSGLLDGERVITRNQLLIYNAINQ